MNARGFSAPFFKHLSPSELRLEHSVARAMQKELDRMLETIAVILVVLWLLGVVSSYTLGGYIHILLVVAIIMVLLRLISGRKPL
ncbi:MAG TPA: lmo0937 family membrane protein [Candidatus Didemnitutus sp.]|jgi:predicted ferric reductase